MNYVPLLTGVLPDNMLAGLAFFGTVFMPCALGLNALVGRVMDHFGWFQA